MSRTAALLLLAAALPLAARAADTPSQVLSTPVAIPAADAMPEDGVGMRILEAYQDGGSTRFIIQSRQPLVTGRSLYLGLKEEAVTIGPIMSRTGGTYYVAASAPGRLSIKPGDSVRLEKTRPVSLPEAVLRALSASHGYEQKRVAEVLAVQGDRVMIDKGTLHEVHERDLYRIIDASGTLKGSLEVRGIGDFQSSALTNLAGARGGAGLPVQPGDYAVFIGQRRLFGLGLIGGTRNKRTQTLYAFDSSAGGGLLWSLSAYNGWGIEAVAGAYLRDSQDSTVVNGDNFLLKENTRDNRSARYLAPVWVKKNFFFRSLVSPYAAGGLYWFEGSHSFDVILGSNLVSLGRENKQRHGFYPVLGMGVEFLPTRFFRPRLEVRHFVAPTLEARGNKFAASSTFYSVGVLTSW